MEGQRCEEPGCSLHDFLPFLCSRCDHWYCLDHRSRFIHHCIPTTGDEEHPPSRSSNSSSGQSVKGMMQAVEDRHKAHAAAHMSPPPAHHRIQTQQALPTQSPSFQQSMHKLDHITSHSVYDREKRASDATKRMLIKQKAIGNDQLLPELRLYLTLHFEDMPSSNPHTSPVKGSALRLEPTQEVVYFFCSKSALLGEVLQQIKTRFGQYCLVAPEFRANVNLSSASSTFSNQYSLALSTLDASNWRDWNRTTAMKDLLQNFEDVWISLVPTTHAIEAQDQLKTVLQQRAAQQQQQEQAAKVAAAEKAEPPKPHSFSKGELAWYYKTPPPREDEEDYTPIHLHTVEEAKQAQIPVILVKVIGVHHDDFPNIYYTISLVKPVQGLGADHERLIFHTEKQTDAAHLLEYHEPSPEEQKRIAVEELQKHIFSLGDVFTIRASYNKEEYTNIRISAKSSLAQLRLLLSIYSSVPVPNLKMIYKGVVLKQDNLTVAAVKIVPNAKIVIMGSS